MMRVTPTIPDGLDDSLVSEEFISDPYPTLERLRESDPSPLERLDRRLGVDPLRRYSHHF